MTTSQQAPDVVFIWLLIVSLGLAILASGCHISTDRTDSVTDGYITSGSYVHRAAYFYQDYVTTFVPC